MKVTTKNPALSVNFRNTFVGTLAFDILLDKKKCQDFQAQLSDNQFAKNRN